MDKYVLVDDKGEMLAIGFSEDERKLIEASPEQFKEWVNINSL